MATVVAGSVKDYPWGMIDGMVPWTGRGTGKPQAELWFGVHPAGPSRTVDGSSADQVLAGTPVPLLVKILAAASPLSIQIHPDAAQAARGYAEQPAGKSVFTDASGKDEIVVAMAEFQALVGWRAPEEAAEVLAALGYAPAACAAARAGDWSLTARLVLAGPPDQQMWDPGRLRRAIPTDDPREAAALGDLAVAFPQDPGVGLAAILRYLRLESGDAVYVPAGVPHAYLRGVGLEVMTSSDNVLRLGLTKKEIAIEDALRAIRNDLSPTLLTGTGIKAPPGAPFKVAVQRGARTSLGGGRYRVVLAIDGPVTVTIKGAGVELMIGQGMLIPATDPAVAVSTDAMVALVEAVRDEGGASR